MAAQKSTQRDIMPYSFMAVTLFSHPIISLTTAQTHVDSATFLTDKIETKNSTTNLCLLPLFLSITAMSSPSLKSYHNRAHNHDAIKLLE